MDYQLWIDGRWSTGQGGQLPVENPATGTVRSLRRSGGGLSDHKACDGVARLAK
jgi:hypothetical protein